jgi:NAD(P)-dependent dehydrogenase (short-subunit alcohol dehydrogenase family)
MIESILQNRVILVSGAGGGLGSVAAKACASHGATVILLGKTIAKLEKVYDDIVQAGLPQPAIYPIDFAGATENDYRDLAGTVEREFGALHGLLHCAAELKHLGPLADLSGIVWQRLMQVNLTAAFLLTRELLPLLAKSSDPAIVFTTDSVAREGRAYWGAYGIAKIAVEGFAKILANEQEGKMRVSVFTPGPMASPLRRKVYPGESPESLPNPARLGEHIVHLLGPMPR